jgi:hypothetical protein
MGALHPFFIQPPMGDPLASPRGWTSREHASHVRLEERQELHGDVGGIEFGLHDFSER